MQRRSVTRSDPRHKQLRTQNNISVKKSREKSRREHEETLTAINQLEQDNCQLTEHLQILKQEYEQLRILFKQHTGIDIDQMATSETKSTPQLPVPSEDNSSKSVLTINTTVENSSVNNELDAKNLDGSIVVINGVQYKIVKA